MISRKSKHTSVLIELQVPYSGPEQPHEAFANLRAEPEARKAFAHRFGTMKSHPEVLAGAFGPPKDITDKRIERLRKAWQGDTDAMEQLRREIGLRPFKLKIEGKRIVMEPKSQWSSICFLFLRDQATGKTAICANPDCHSPYFIKKRKTQKYCTSGPCTQQAQREQKRLWWERNYGKETK
jgi:hypothetical protein